MNYTTHAPLNWATIITWWKKAKMICCQLCSMWKMRLFSRIKPKAKANLWIRVRTWSITLKFLGTRMSLIRFLFDCYFIIYLLCCWTINEKNLLLFGACSVVYFANFVRNLTYCLPVMLWVLKHSVIYNPFQEKSPWLWTMSSKYQPSPYTTILAEPTGS